MKEKLENQKNPEKVLEELESKYEKTMNLDIEKDYEEILNTFFEIRQKLETLRPNLQQSLLDRFMLLRSIVNEFIETAEYQNNLSVWEERGIQQGKEFLIVVANKKNKQNIPIYFNNEEEKDEYINNFNLDNFAKNSGGEIIAKDFNNLYIREIILLV